MYLRIFRRINELLINFSALPIFEQNKYIIDIEYSPLVTGFAVVLNDGRAAVLTASSLKFDPNVCTEVLFLNLRNI